jgi:hypothetical protein
VVAVREHFCAKQASWRVPTVLFAGFLGMGVGGWAPASYTIISVLI